MKIGMYDSDKIYIVNNRRIKKKCYIFFIGNYKTVYVEDKFGDKTLDMVKKCRHFNFRFKNAFDIVDDHIVVYCKNSYMNNGDTIKLIVDRDQFFNKLKNTYITVSGSKNIMCKFNTYKSIYWVLYHKTYKELAFKNGNRYDLRQSNVVCGSFDTNSMHHHKQYPKVAGISESSVSFRCIITKHGIKTTKIFPHTANGFRAACQWVYAAKLYYITKPDQTLIDNIDLNTREEIKKNPSKYFSINK